MISKYGGRCKGCGTPYAEGDDIYWSKEDGAWCWPCRDNPKPGPAAFALAEELGFEDHMLLMDAERMLTNRRPH